MDYLLLLILLGTGLQGCGWSTGAGKAALSHGNETYLWKRGTEDTRQDCPELISVDYCDSKRIAVFNFNGSEEYLSLPVQFEANGIPISTNCRCLNSTAGTLVVFMNEVSGGGNFTFQLSQPYSQCDRHYSGRYENGRLYMDNGIKVKNSNDSDCRPDSGMPNEGYSAVKTSLPLLLTVFIGTYHLNLCP